MTNMINTRFDLDALAISDPAAHADFIARLKGSLQRTADIRVYPADYDARLRPDAAGYLAPIFGVVPDETTAVRFGYTAAELLALP